MLMLRTVAECNRALELLDMERDHILKVRTFLEINGPVLALPSKKPKVTTDAILQVVIDNPGIDGLTVRELINTAGFDVQSRQVGSALSRLARSGEIENRGRHGLGARWYEKESVDGGSEQNGAR